MARIYKASDVFKPINISAEEKAIADAKYARLMKVMRGKIILGKGDIFNLGLDNVR